MMTLEMILDRCTLPGTERPDRIRRLRDLLAGARSVRRTGRGLTIDFDRDRLPDVRALAALEARCCSFLDITVDDRENTVEMSVTTNDPTLIEGILGLVDR